jgi:hypothetical protein
MLFQRRHTSRLRKNAGTSSFRGAGSAREPGIQEHGPEKSKRLARVHVGDDQTFTTDTGNYIGSNAFGVTKVITKKVIHSYALGLANENSLTHAWPHTDFTYSFTIAPDVAYETKNHLEVIFIGKPSIPVRFNFMEHFDPTLSNPSDVTKYVHGSTIDVRCAALVNGADGKLIQNIK